MVIRPMRMRMTKEDLENVNNMAKKSKEMRGSRKNLIIPFKSGLICAMVASIVLTISCKNKKYI
jgi:hypothetical protein